MKMATILGAIMEEMAKVHPAFMKCDGLESDLPEGIRKIWCDVTLKVRLIVYDI